MGALVDGQPSCLRVRGLLGRAVLPPGNGCHDLLGAIPAGRTGSRAPVGSWPAASADLQRRLAGTAHTEWSVRLPGGARDRTEPVASAHWRIADSHIAACWQ